MRARRHGREHPRSPPNRGWAIAPEPPIIERGRANRAEARWTFLRATGRRVAVLDGGRKEAGTYRIRWDGSAKEGAGARGDGGARSITGGLTAPDSAPRGVYFIRVRAGEAVWTERVVRLTR